MLISRLTIICFLTSFALVAFVVSTTTSGACSESSSKDDDVLSARQAVRQMRSSADKGWHAQLSSKLQPDPSPAPVQAAAQRNGGGSPFTDQDSDIELEESKIFDQNSIIISRPKLQALITISEGMNPLELDASQAQIISLHDALLFSINNNLDIGISASSESVQRDNYVGALGKFAPDVLLSYNGQRLRGRANVPLLGAVPSLLRLDTPFIITSAGFRVWGYQGGKILFGALQSRHNYRAATAARKATISDVLLDVSKRYYNLVLNDALLQIRIKAVETSASQLTRNSDLHQDGLATNLDVLQAKTQLSRDRQSLIDQQVTRRNASLQLAHSLNSSLAIDYLPGSSLVSKIRLLSQNMKIGDIVKLAIENRPELKQYEELRLAAKRAIVVAGAPLQPKLQLLGTVYGIGETLSRDTVTVPASFAPVALAGTPTSTQALGTIRTTTAGGGALPAGPFFPVGAAIEPATSVSRQLAALYSLSLRVDWDFNGLGIPDAGAVAAARASARQAHLQASKELTDVIEQVRSAYLSALSSEKQIDEAADEVTSAREALRLAQLRFTNGLGTNIDIIQAQRDYTQALIDKAQAIINFNLAQCQLLHDTGLISVGNLTAIQPAVR